MSYSFYIDEVRLPVAPSEMTTKIKNQNKTVTLADGSELNLIKLPGLSDVSFDVLLPRYELPFAVYEGEFLAPDYFLSLFERLKIEGRVFTLRILRNEGFEGTERACTLEKYTIKEKATNGFDYIVSLELKHYDYKKTETLNFVANSDNKEAVAETQRPVTSGTETLTHKVVQGDTLWAIARRHYGDGSRYTEIYVDNKDVIEAAAKAHGRASSSDGWWIYPGTELTIKNAVKVGWIN